MLQPGTELQGRYQIVRLLGRGGMGAVYEARDLRLDTTVAVKDCRFDEPELVRQFEREARLLARLRHPAVTRVIDHFSEGEATYLVMEFIPGDDLNAMMAKGARFSAGQVIGWTDQLLDALDYLHSQQHPVIHRDIKPANLKLMPHGQIILLDFGLAKGSTGQTTMQTGPKSVYGYTPNYAPLEQIHGTEGTDARSDLYSLSATMYHLLTGVMPPGTLLRLSKTTDGAPDPLQPLHVLNPQVPPAVSEVFARALSIARDRRPASATEMRSLMRQATDGQTVQREPTLPTPPPPGPLPPHTSMPHPSAPVNVVNAPPKGRAGGLLLALVLLGLIAVAIGTAVFFVLKRAPESKPGAVSQSSAAKDLGSSGGRSLSAPAAKGFGRGGGAGSDSPRVFKGHTESVWNVAFSPDGATLASASWDGTARLWDVATGRERLTIPRKGLEVTAVAFSRDGKTVAVGGYDASGSRIGFFDPATGRPLREEFTDPANLVSDVAFAADGRFAAVIGSSIRFWDLGRGEELLTIAGNANPSMAFSPDGSLIAIGSTNDHNVALRARSGELSRALAGHAQGILSLAYEPDGRVLASGSYDSTIRLWPMDSNAFPLILSLPDLDKAHSLGYSPDGSTLAAGTDNHLRLWNARDRSELKTIRTGCLAYGLAWSPSSKHVALGCSDGRVLLFQPVP